MTEIGLAAATYAELGLEALLAGDIPRAVGTLASIDSQAWAALVERFPGFPEQLLAAGAHEALPPHLQAAIEQR